MEPNNNVPPIEPQSQPPVEPSVQPPAEEPVAMPFGQPIEQPTVPTVEPQAAPQPVQMPVQPVQPVQPFPTAPVASSVPAQSSNNTKKLIIIGAIAGGFIVLALVAWFVYSLLFAVSKEDYRQAAKVSNETVSLASSAYTDVLKISYLSAYSTMTQTKNDVESAKESLAAYKTANDKFKDLKALRDKDVKTAYDTYMTKYDAFVAFAGPYIASAEKAIPAVLGCEKVSSASVTDVASFKAAILPCKDALDAAKNINDKDLKSFITAYLNNIDKISAILDEYAALPANDYTKRSALRNQIYDETDKLQDAQKDANSNVEKRLKDVNPREAYNAFGEVITDKQLK